jgi:hypothetical protein
MQIETIGHCQVHLIALELPEGGKWDAFFSILKFDDAAGDFISVLDKHQVESGPELSYDAAIESARRAANRFIEACTD